MSQKQPLQSDLWLVRTSHLQILGPFTQSELVSQMERGEFSGNDEVCKANEYWFNLSDSEEVMKNLGVPPLKAMPHDPSEITTTTEAPLMTGFPPQSPHRNHFDSPEELESHIQAKTFFPKPLEVHEMGSSKMGAPILARRGPKVEKLSLWKGLAVALMMALGIVLLAVVRMLTVSH